jgi:hypothetical protein
MDDRKKPQPPKRKGDPPKDVEAADRTAREHAREAMRLHDEAAHWFHHTDHGQ